MTPRPRLDDDSNPCMSVPPRNSVDLWELSEPSWTALIFPDLSDSRLRGAATHDAACQLAASLGGFVVPAPTEPEVDLKTAPPDVVAAVLVDASDPDEAWRRDALLAVRRTLHNKVKMTRALLAGVECTRMSGDRRAFAPAATRELRDQRVRAEAWVPGEADDPAIGPDPLPDAFWLPTEAAWRAFGTAMRTLAASLTGDPGALAMMGHSNGVYRPPRGAAGG